MIETKENFSNDSNTIRGLCLTCNNAKTCIFRISDVNRYIWYCELFDCYVQDEELPQTVTKTNVAEAEKDIYGNFEGLCMNCENRNTCTFPKPAGGIWHCEEYR